MANVRVPPFTEAPQTVVGGAPQTTFPFAFPYWSSADLLVYVDGDLIDSSDYTVEGFDLQDALVVEGGYGSGAVTFDAALSNCTVTIDRLVVGDRQTQFSRSIPLDMRALNGDMNRLTARQQDLERHKANRPAGDLAGKFLAFDTDGNEVASSGTGADAGLRADLAATAGTGLLGWLQAGVGAILRTLLSKLFEMPVTPEDFGAVGDGNTNDAVPFGRALTHACTTGKRFMGGAGKTYRIATEISINRAGMPEVVIDGNGSRVIADEAGIIFTGDTHFLTTTLSADPVRGDAKLTLASVAGIVQGDLIEILNPAYTQGTVAARHVYLVSELDGNDVYIEGSVVNDINAAQIAASGATGSISVKVYHLCKQITVQNWEFTARAATAVTASLQITNSYRVVTNNLTFDGHCRVQLLLQYNGHTLDTGHHFRDFGYINKNIGYANLPAGADVIGNPVDNSPDGLSYGYGVIHQLNYSSAVAFCSAGHGWHLADAAIGQMWITYVNCISSRNGHGLNCHEGVWNATYINCELRGTQGLNVGRACRAHIRGCKFTDTRQQSIVYSNEMSELVIEGCEFDVQSAATPVLYAVYRSTSTTAAPGAGQTSTGYKQIFEFKDSSLYGYCSINAGFIGPTGDVDGTLLVTNITAQRAAFDISAMKNTVIHDIRFVGVQTGFAISLSQTTTTTLISIEDVTEIGGYTTGGVLIYFVAGSSPLRCSINGCKTTGTVMRSDFAITIDEMNACTARGFLAIGSGTIKNAVNNLSISSVSGVTITNGVNNTTMTA